MRLGTGHEADGKVHVAAIEIDDGEAGRDAHVDLGMRRGEAGQPRDQPERGEARRAGDGHLPRGGGAPHARRGIAQALQAVVDGALHHAAGFGEHDGPVLPFEQCHAQRGFQLLHLPAHRRLRQRELGARGREAQVAGRCLERVEQVQPQLPRTRQAVRRGREGHLGRRVTDSSRIRWLHAWHAESPLVAAGCAQYSHLHPA
jgi:hypothetical protein